MKEKASEIRHINSDGERVVWRTRKHLSFYMEDLHDNHLVRIYKTQIDNHPDKPILDYIWSEIIYRELEELVYDK